MSQITRLTTVTVPPNIKAFAYSRETSLEIAAALFELAGGDEDGAAHLWSEPDEEITQAVIARAWEFAEPDEAELYWGTWIIIRRD